MVDGHAAGAASPPRLRRSLHGGQAHRRGRRHIRAARSSRPQHGGDRRHAVRPLVLFLATDDPLARTVQSGRQGAAQRRAPLRPERPALRFLPRPRPAVFLRLLQERRRAARAGPARQEAAHRREAAAAARPEGARHRLGLGRPGPVPRPAVRRRRHRRHAVDRAAQRLEPPRARGRPGRPRALQAARLSPGDPTATTASSPSACSSMSASPTTSSTSAR